MDLPRSGEGKTAQFLLRLLRIGLLAAAAWLGLRYLLPWVLPFLLALASAALLEPVVRWLHGRLKCPRALAAGLCTLALLFLLGGLIFLLAGRAVYELTSFIKELPTHLARVPNLFASAEDALYRYIIAAPVELQGFLEQTLESLKAQSSKLPAELYTRLFDWLSGVLSAAPRILLFIVTFGISAFFMSSSYPTVRAFLLRQVPLRRRVLLREMKSSTLDTLGKWLRAQLALMGVTFVELCCVFLLLGIDYAALLALVVALIDALPVFGAGTVLIPWAIVCLITGQYQRAIILLVAYAVGSLVRSLLEPKLLGSQSGPHPVATLLAIYVGFQAAGVIGMLLAPFLLMVAKTLNDRGVIHLWK